MEILISIVAVMLTLVSIHIFMLFRISRYLRQIYFSNMNILSSIPTKKDIDFLNKQIAPISEVARGHLATKMVAERVFDEIIEAKNNLRRT